MRTALVITLTALALTAGAGAAVLAFPPGYAGVIEPIVAAQAPGYYVECEAVNHRLAIRCSMLRGSTHRVVTYERVARCLIRGTSKGAKPRTFRPSSPRALRALGC